MNNQYELAENYALLKKCQKTHGILFYYFLISGIPVILFSFLSLVCIPMDKNLIMKAGAEPLSPSYLLLLGDSVLFAPLASFLGCRLALKQHDLSAILCVLLLGINLGLFIYNRNWNFFHRVPVSFWLFIVYNIAGISASIWGFITNIKYHWLEKQPGFPQFNERFEDQNVKIDQFQCEYNRLKRTSTDQMEELPAPKLTDTDNVSE